MPASPVVPVDPRTCPLCGNPNGCAMESAKTTGQAAQTCWCVNVGFSAELLARVPSSAKRKACICETCAQQDAATQGVHHV